MSPWRCPIKWFSFQATARAKLNPGTAGEAGTYGPGNAWQTTQPEWHATEVEQRATILQQHSVTMIHQALFSHL
jgi:hypothetical protein